MPVELEAKMKVEDLDATRKHLRDVGATRVGSVIEINAYFDTPDRRLKRSDEGLRVRRERDEETGDDRCRVTFKGKQGEGDLKQREELESDVTDADAVETILAKLGLVRTLRFEKRRETWTLNSCEIVLDELPVLGTFVEIEGDDEAAVMRARDRLGLGDAPLLTEGYATMLGEHFESDPSPDVKLSPSDQPRHDVP